MCLAIPGKVDSVETIGDNRIAQVNFGGVKRTVFLDLVPEADTGDFVMVHVGFAISRVDEQEAKENYDLLERLGFLDEMGDAAS